MKKLVFAVLMAVLGAVSIESSAKTISSETNIEWYEQNATLKVVNNSDYYMTLKVMKEYGGVYTTLYIPSRSSSVVSFSRSGRFYIKMKAEKGLDVLYKKDSPFSIQCDDNGYTEATLSYYVSGSGGSNAGQSISRKEFESNN